MNSRDDITIRLGSDLKTRDDARLLSRQIDLAAGSVIFDFSDVGFMGRSFADEFYNLFIKSSGLRHSTIKCINESDSVKSMFKTVKSTQQKAKAIDKDAKEISFTNIKDLNVFLYAL